MNISSSFALGWLGVVLLQPRCGLLADTLDQSFLPPSNPSPYAVFDDRTPPASAPWFQQLAQTFAVGRSGVLGAIEVDIYGVTASGPLHYDVRPTAGGIPQEGDAPVLASGTIPYSDVIAAIGDGPPGGFLEIDVSAFGIAVAPGQVLAIVLECGDNQGYAWLGSHDPDGYLGGSAFSRNDSHATWHDFGADLGFRTHVIPEPSSISLGLLLLGLLGVCRRRRAWIRPTRGRSELSGTVMTLLAALVGVSGSATAGLILVPGPYNGATQIQQGNPMGQTFTAEAPFIQSVGFSVRDLNPSAGPADFTLRISLYAGAGTTGSWLGAGEYTSLTPGYQGFIDVDFASVSLMVGGTYTAIISDTTPRWGLEHTDSPGAYLGGMPVFQGVPHNYADYALRVIPIPEPSAVAMACVGGLLLLAARGTRNGPSRLLASSRLTGGAG